MNTVQQAVLVGIQHGCVGQRGDTACLWSPTGWVYAIDVISGAVRWHHQSTRCGHQAANWGPMMAGLLTFENKLHCLDMNQELPVHDAATGHEVQRTKFALDQPPRCWCNQNSKRLRPTHQVIST